MRRQIVGLRTWAVLLGALAMTAAPRAWAQDAPRPDARPVYAKANKQALKAYVVLLRLRHDLFLRWKDSGKWPDDKEANAALAGHSEYWAKQLAQGHTILAGGMDGDYWDNVALIVFEAASEEEARSIVKDDPAVKAYVFQAQVRPFTVSTLTNKYAGRE
jgi:uncharacterized protein YciI